MFGTVRRLLRLRGPLGVLAIGVAAGALAGLLVTHAVLAAWTYRDAARRDLRSPGRYALAVLVGGLVAFAPYALWQWAADAAAAEGGVAAALRAAVREYRRPDADGQDAGEPPAGGQRDGEASAAADPDADLPAAADGGSASSLALTTARYGVKAAGLGVRSARWAGRRAVARVTDRPGGAMNNR